MGRSDWTFDDQHREAIARAALEDGLSAREAVEKAAAGELYGLEPFEPAVSTAQDWIAAAKREGHSSGYRDRLDSIVQRALEVIEAEMEKINPNGRLDLPRAKRAIQLAQHVARLVPLIDAEPPATPTRSPSPATPPERSARLLEEMLSDLERTATGSTPAVSENGESEHGPAEETLAEKRRRVAEELGIPPEATSTWPTEPEAD